MTTLDYDGTPVEIDVGIAPLITALWARRIETASSCEDIDTSGADFGANPTGCAYVAFFDRHDARRFARTCRLGRAVDPLVVALDSPAPQEFAGGDDYGFEPGGVAFTVLFPADRIDAVAELLRA